jgi:hypothetical protein
MRSMFAIIILAMISSPAWAQGTPSILLGPGTAALCFDVVPATGDTPFGPILINHCTGATWLLVREDVSDVKGTPTENLRFSGIRSGVPPTKLSWGLVVCLDRHQCLVQLLPKLQKTDLIPVDDDFNFG